MQQKKKKKSDTTFLMTSKIALALPMSSVPLSSVLSSAVLQSLTGKIIRQQRDQVQSNKMAYYKVYHQKMRSGAIHKRRQNILEGWENGGLKFPCCKILKGRSQIKQGQNFDMGEGDIINDPKNSHVVYGRPVSSIGRGRTIMMGN